MHYTTLYPYSSLDINSYQQTVFTCQMVSALPVHDFISSLQSPYQGDTIRIPIPQESKTWGGVSILPMVEKLAPNQDLTPKVMFSSLPKQDAPAQTWPSFWSTTGCQATVCRFYQTPYSPLLLVPHTPNTKHVSPSCCSF